MRTTILEGVIREVNCKVKAPATRIQCGAGVGGTTLQAK